MEEEDNDNGSIRSALDSDEDDGTRSWRDTLIMVTVFGTTLVVVGGILFSIIWWYLPNTDWIKSVN